MTNRKVRIAMFGSFYRGYYVLNELLFGDIAASVEVVGVATDEPSNHFISADKRVWQYPHSEYERNMVADLAAKHELPVFRHRVNDDAFYAIFEQQWRPQLCIMATFGQRIRHRLMEYPQLGFYNLHPCIDDAWPSKYVGGNPFDALMRDGMSYTRVALHAINEDFDSGELIGMTPRIAIPDESTVVDLHKITSFAAARLAADELQKIIDRASQLDR